MFNFIVQHYFSVLALAGFLFFCACKEKDESPEPRADLTIPSSYDGSAYSTNASTQLAVVNQLISLTNEAKKGRTSGVSVNAGNLENLFNAGNPSLSAVVSSFFKNKLSGSNGWFVELANASGNVYAPGPPATSDKGGVFGSGSSAYLFDETGLEIEQLIEKGQFGATLYKHAIDLMTGEMTAASADKLVAIFGATPAFANSGSNNVPAENRDRMMANYAARRDKNDGNGFYSQLKKQFIKLQAALKAGSNYNTERDAAIAEIKKVWEKVNAATIINYCHSVISTMSQTAPTNDQKASALHAYAECVGFIYGWKELPQAHKLITDTQIDEVLVLLNIPSASSYKFITSPETELAKLQQIISKLQAIYGFSSQEIEDFKNNWVTVQNR
jgi:hypothetical protein